MKILPLLLLAGTLATGRLGAHDHLETRLTGSKLSVAGSLTQTATYFPRGEAPSFSLQYLPGAAFISELTFSAFETTASPAEGATVVVQVLSITGPAGGAISFWEQYLGQVPAFTKSTGWTAGAGDTPTILVSEGEDGYGHIHGRAFSMSEPGEYFMRLRVVDTQGNYQASDPFEVRFTAQAPPPLSIAIVGSNAQLSLHARDGFTYDLQSSTTLDVDDWETIDTQDGEGVPLTFTDPQSNRPTVFYRLVEY